MLHPTTLDRRRRQHAPQFLDRKLGKDGLQLGGVPLPKRLVNIPMACFGRLGPFCHQPMSREQGSYLRRWLCTDRIMRRADRQDADLGLNVRGNSSWRPLQCASLDLQGAEHIGAGAVIAVMHAEREPQTSPPGRRESLGIPGQKINGSTMRMALTGPKWLLRIVPTPLVLEGLKVGEHLDMWDALCDFEFQTMR